MIRLALFNIFLLSTNPVRKIKTMPEKSPSVCQLSKCPFTYHTLLITCSSFCPVSLSLLQCIFVFQWSCSGDCVPESCFLVSHCCLLFTVLMLMCMYCILPNEHFPATGQKYSQISLSKESYCHIHFRHWNCNIFLSLWNSSNSLVSYWTEHAVIHRYTRLIISIPLELKKKKSFVG